MGHRRPGQIGAWVRTPRAYDWYDRTMVRRLIPPGSLARIADDADNFTLTVLLPGDTLADFFWIDRLAVVAATPTEEELSRWALATLLR